MKYSTAEEIKAEQKTITEKFKGDNVSKEKALVYLGKSSLAEFIHQVPNKSAEILDFGAGGGMFIKQIHDNGFIHVCAADIDDYRRPDVKKMTEEFKTFDASNEPFPWSNERFDVVTAWEIFEHLENPHRAMREIYRVLKKDGLLFMSVPNIFHIVSRLIFLKRGLFPRWNKTNNHIAVFPRGIFEKTFLKYFDLVEEKYFFSQINLPLLKHIKFLPENQWFGNWVFYLLRKK
ncbi:MAG: class I SAM-dependent methyltransferase [Candidatus Paceibacterota bacterium]|jgi:2-polyprenyl-3-methyl-5-hydroxy-6-metoxy-1,4-benzoquinol methylase